MVRWFNLVREWWGTMSGWLSIPFAFLALFNIPGRYLFAALAYISLWARVIAQAKRISELQRAMPSPNVAVRIGDDLVDLAHDSYWIRGEIENSSEYRAESCRMKLLKVEGQGAQNPHVPLVEHGPLQWQGGGCEPRTLDPHEKLIFDVGIRPCGDDSPLILLVYFRGNEVRRVLPTPGHYKLTLGIYGSNISTMEKLVSITVGKTPREIDFTA